MPSTKARDLEKPAMNSETIHQAFKKAVRKALAEHKRAGNPIAVYEDGKVKIIPPEEIVIPEETD